MLLNARVLEGPEEVNKHVVILHGLFAASDNLLRLGKHLAEGYTVHLLDLRNHGNSFHVTDMNYLLMANDVNEYLTHQNINSVALIGHSMGGKTAMQYALSYPDTVEALIVADIAPVEYKPAHVQILKGLEYLANYPPANRQEADTALNKFVEDVGVRQFLIKNLKAVGEESKKLGWRFNLNAIQSNYYNVLAAPVGEEFNGPTLFIAGALSDYIAPEYRDITTKLFPHAQLKVIPDTSHWLHAEKPQVFNALCERFLHKHFISQ
ncbi:MAG: alpha/beta fold hydrolase [Oleiphilaceae bacterium]|nr:alpha/beta fold hydrolase [Oleiphilaceae bacterium]